MSTGAASRYPAWKHALVWALVALGAFYALPSAYSKSPVVQARASSAGQDATRKTLGDVRAALRAANLEAVSVKLENGIVEAKFADGDSQLAARAAMAKALGREFVVALNTSSDAPGWMSALGADPLALGLDLRGGVYFLLRVDIAFAVNRRLNGLAGGDDFRAVLRRFAATATTEGEDIVVALQSADDYDAMAEAIVDAFPQLEEGDSDSETTLRMQLTGGERSELADLTMEQNLQTLRNRVDELGVAEPVITRQGSERIAVQLPGVQDTARAKSVLGRTAALELRGVDESKTSSRSLIRRAERGRPPSGTELYETRDGEKLLVGKRAVISGDNITDARPGFDQQNRPAVHLSLDIPGAEKIKRHTRPRIGERLAILLIDRDSAEIISAPVVQEELYANFIIHGRMNNREANELALLLRAGALAAPLEIIEERAVGPSLGADNIKSGINSVIGGFIGVALFIAAYYAMFGLISVTALLANLFLLTALLGLVGATLTLPGLAGFALTLGMAIDANVLINERVREEIAQDKTPLAAISAGYNRALTTILDSNLTTLIAGLALFAFGSGPVRGFAVVLCFGLLTSMFSAVQGSRALVNLTCERRARLPNLSLGLWQLRFKKVLPLMEWRKVTAALSAVLVTICIGSLSIRGLNLGVDFTGGTVVEASMSRQTDIGAIRAAAESAGLENAPIQQSGDGLVIIKAPPHTAGADLSERVLSALREVDPGAELRRVEFVGPQVGSELFLAGALALICVCLGIAAYLSVRFKWRMAVGAILANLHDVLFILGLFSIFQWEFSLPVLAAILAILGYSVNESVVIFDRVREIFRVRRRGDSPERVVNEAVTQTWSRTVITHGSTQMAVLAMLFFGGDALFLFALALTIGIFSSIYSSVLVAPAAALRLGMTRDDFILRDDKGKADNPAGAVV